MRKVITMYAGDREIIRVSNSVLQLVVSLLDGINDVALGTEQEAITECVVAINNVRARLNSIRSRAVTYELSPGDTRP